MSKRSYLAVSISYVLAGALAGAAHAQQAPNNVSALEEIVVTAQKRAESLQEVPVAVTALTDKTRELVGIKTVQDMTDFTPSLVYYNGLDRMVLRGIGRLTNNAGTEPGVATYVDGFYVTSNILVGVSDLFNERVEILRGPQGTLYGRNAVGGAINTISRRPTDDWSGEVRTTVANYDRTVAEGTFSGPIGGGWKFRLSANDTQQNRGYYRNIGTAPSEGSTAHDHLYDAQLMGSIGPMDVWLKYFKYQLNDTSRILNISVPYATTSPQGTLVPNPAYQYTVPNPALTDPRAVNTDTPATFRVNGADMWIGHLTWHLGGADVNYIGGYYRYDLHLTNDSDNISRQSYLYQPTVAGTGAPAGAPVTVFADQVFLYEEFHNYYTNEVNVTSTGDGPFQWIVGAYQLNEHLYEPFNLSVPNQPQLQTPLFAFPPFAAAAPNPLGAYVLQTGRLHTKAEAVFAQTDWRFADDWKLTTGIRYNKDDKEGEALQRYVSWNPSAAPFYGASAAFDITSIVAGYPTGTSPAIMDVRRVSKDVSGVIGTEWQPNKDTNLYLKYSRGSKAGALNLGQVSYSNPASTTVGPEKLDAIEFGIKQQVSTLQVNAALFYYNYKDAQIPTTILVQGVALPQFINIEKMRDYGAELETIWQPVDPLTVILNYSYLNTKVQEAIPFLNTLSGAIESVVGNQMLGSPKNKLSAAVSYRVNFEPGSLNFTVTDSWRDTQYSSLFNSPAWQTPSYNVVGARIMWSGADNSYNVIAYINNLTDKLAADAVGASTGSTGVNQAFGYLPPRTYGLELQYRWGAAK